MPLMITTDQVIHFSTPLLVRIFAALKVKDATVTTTEPFSFEDHQLLGTVVVELRKRGVLD